MGLIRDSKSNKLYRRFAYELISRPDANNVVAVRNVVRCLRDKNVNTLLNTRTYIVLRVREGELQAG